MPHPGRWIAVGVGVVIIAALVYGLLSASLSALPAPGATETALANRLKAWYIQRAARAQPPLPPPPFRPAAASGLFSMACAVCHGPDGRHPAAIGLSMYPRVLDLGSPEVQRFSNAQLYWIIHNGIRLSGMPGFGHILAPQDVWQLTLLLRHLPVTTPTQP